MASSPPNDTLAAGTSADLAKKSVTATFSGGVLSVFGDDVANTFTISRNSTGFILVNGGDVRIEGGKANVNNTTLIRVFGQDGNDIISIDESNGALPHVELFGGAGNDILTAGSGNDALFGGT